MSDYAITCGSTSDLPKEFYEENDIHCGLFHFEIGGVDYLDDLGEFLSYDDFYKLIEEGNHPRTSQLTQQDYINLWTPLLEEGKDIIDVGLSSGITSGFNNAMMVKKALEEKYPERRITVIDSKAATGGYGMLMVYIVKHRDEGMSYDELVEWIEKNKLNIHCWFFSTNLTGYLRGGRISKSSHIFGTMFKFCPLININSEGKLIPREKIRGKNKALKAIYNKMVEHAQGGLDYSGKCFVYHTAFYDEARSLADRIEENFPNLDGKVFIHSVGTVVGSHMYPGSICLFFVGDERTE